MPVSDTLIIGIKSFILERLKSFYLGQEIASEVITSVLCKQDEWLFDFDKRLKAMCSFRLLPEAKRFGVCCQKGKSFIKTNFR